MLIEADYRGHRIEVNAQHVDGAWEITPYCSATVAVGFRHVTLSTCGLSSVNVRRMRTSVSHYARRWVDRHGAG